MKLKLDKEEQELLDSFENGGLRIQKRKSGGIKTAHGILWRKNAGTEQILQYCYQNALF